MNIHKCFWALRGLCYKMVFRRFGNCSYIGKPTYLLGTKNIIIEDRVRIYPGARLEAYNRGRIIIGENTSIAQNFHCTSDGDFPLTIGKNTTISGNVFVTNIDHDYTDIETHILDQKRIIKETTIGDNCFIGFGAAIQAGTILGKHCVVGTNAVVRGVFPDYSVIVGVPAKVVKKYSFDSKQWERTK